MSTQGDDGDGKTQTYNFGFCSPCFFHMTGDRRSAAHPLKGHLVSGWNGKGRGAPDYDQR